jgi:hypothetical protein
MGAPLAFLICSVGVAGLFYLNRDKSVRNSMALWLPVFWLWIVGSRPVSSWFGSGGGSARGLASTLDGSPVDAAVFGALVAAGIVVLLNRKRRTSALLAVSGPIVIYFLYCLISVAWSPIHGPALKRPGHGAPHCDRCRAESGASATLLSGRLYSVTLFNCTNPVYRSGSRIRSRREPHEHRGNNKQE